MKRGGGTHMCIGVFQTALNYIIKNGQKRHTTYSIYIDFRLDNTADWFLSGQNTFFFFKVLAALHAFSIYGNMEKGD